MQVYPDADSPQDQASRVINYLNPSRLTFEDGRAKLEFHEVVNGYYNDDVQELLAIFRDEAIGYRCFDGGTLESDPCVAFWHRGLIPRPPPPAVSRLALSSSSPGQSNFLSEIARMPGGVFVQRPQWLNARLRTASMSST